MLRRGWGMVELLSRTGKLISIYEFQAITDTAVVLSAFVWQLKVLPVNKQWGGQRNRVSGNGKGLAIG